MNGPVICARGGVNTRNVMDGCPGQTSAQSQVSKARTSWSGSDAAESQPAMSRFNSINLRLRPTEQCSGTRTRGDDYDGRATNEFLAIRQTGLNE